MGKITVDKILALRPCLDWPRKRIAAFVGDGITAAAIAEDERITVADRRWVLTRLLATLPDGRRRLVLWAAGCAQDVRHLIADEDTRDAADAAIQTAVAWAEGCATTDDCRAAAYATAAAYAANDAATYTAFSAFSAATYAAAGNAAASAAAYDPSLAARHLVALALEVDRG